MGLSVFCEHRVKGSGCARPTLSRAYAELQGATTISCARHMAVKNQTTLPQEPVATEGLRSGRAPRRRLVTREVVLAWVAFAVVGTLAFAPHVRHGGFYSDDWANAAATLYPLGGRTVGHALSSFAEVALFRPVLVVYIPLTYFVFGTHMAFLLAWTAVLAMFAAAMLYGVLRTLGVPALHAWFICALTIVYPWFDSTRLWETENVVSLSIGLMLAGLWIALLGLKRSSWRLHGCAACLYMLSILTYEVTLPFIAALGVLYTLRAGWRVARMRWALDLVVVVACGLWVGSHTTREKRGLSADLTHLKMIVTSGGTILGRTFIPVGEQRTTLAIVIFALIVTIGLTTRLIWRARFSNEIGWGLQSWLLLAGGGVLTAALGWMIYIPANPYYTPSIYGVTNRVNALAGFGLVIAVYAALGIVGVLVSQLWPRTRALAPTTTLMLGVCVGVAYVNVLERHSKIWNTAFRAEMAGIGEMRMQFPRLPSGTTVFTSNYPANETLGVPIFTANWDVNGMIKLQYKDGTLSAYPVLPGLSLVCRGSGVGIQGVGAPTITAPYGAARLLDVETGRHSQPRNERECHAEAGSYVPGPLYLSLTY